MTTTQTAENTNAKPTTTPEVKRARKLAARLKTYGAQYYGPDDELAVLLQCSEAIDHTATLAIFHLARVHKIADLAEDAQDWLDAVASTWRMLERRGYKLAEDAEEARSNFKVESAVIKELTSLDDAKNPSIDLVLASLYVRAVISITGRRLLELVGELPRMRRTLEEVVEAHYDRAIEAQATLDRIEGAGWMLALMHEVSPLGAKVKDALFMARGSRFLHTHATLKDVPKSTIADCLEPIAPSVAAEIRESIETGRRVWLVVADGRCELHPAPERKAAPRPVVSLAMVRAAKQHEADIAAIFEGEPK